MKILQILNLHRHDGCERLSPLLSAYADGEATESESARIESHIAACDECAAALSDIRTTSRFLKTTREVDPPAYLRGAILAATTSLDAKPAAGKHLRRPLRLQWGFGAAALAGVLAAIVFHANQRPVNVTVGSALPSAPKAAAREDPAAKPPPAPQSPRGELLAAAPAPIPPAAANIKPPSTLFDEAPSPPHSSTILASAPLPAGPVHTVITPAANRVPAVKPMTAVKPMGEPAPMTLPDPQPMPAVETAPAASAPKVEMAVVTTPAPAEAPIAAKDPAPATVEPAATRFTFVAESRALSAGQVSTLADLRKSLRQQSIQWNRQELFRGTGGKQISVGIVKRSF